MVQSNRLNHNVLQVLSGWKYLLRPYFSLCWRHETAIASRDIQRARKRKPTDSSELTPWEGVSSWRITNWRYALHPPNRPGLYPVRRHQHTSIGTSYDITTNGTGAHYQETKLLECSWTWLRWSEWRQKSSTWRGAIRTNIERSTARTGSVRKQIWVDGKSTYRGCSYIHCRYGISQYNRNIEATKLSTPETMHTQAKASKISNYSWDKRFAYNESEAILSCGTAAGFIVWTKITRSAIFDRILSAFEQETTKLLIFVCLNCAATTTVVVCWYCWTCALFSKNLWTAS